ncbi:unnamed protein product [Closterium sp. NIES-54]
MHVLTSSCSDERIQSGPVVLTGHADASWADDQTTQRSSQGYTFSLGSGSVSWRSTRSSFVLSSSCEAEIYAGAMAAQELRWLTYLLTNLGEQPRSPPVLYVDNKAMLALCREHRLEHRTKHIALRYFLARELQQRGQLRLAYVASEANTADIFTKALAPGDHQRLCTLLGFPTFRQVARITGMLASMGVALGATARAFSHAMLQVINDAPSWKSSVIIPPPAAEELNFWLEEFDRFNGAPFHIRNSYDAIIHVDASAHSWGATLTRFPGGLEEASTTMPELLRATSSTQREIEGVLWALQTYSSKITHKQVLVRVDNQGVLFILRKGGLRSPDLTTACQGIIRTCMEHGTRLIIEWIPRELNSHADELSKAIDHDDYSLKTPWFRILERRWGPHSIDLLANSRNSQLPRFYTKIPHPQATAVDAFSLAWRSENSFAFPPPHLVPVVLHHAQRTHASLTLIIPHWPGANWWPLLQPSPRNWAPYIYAHSPLTHGSQCLAAGTHSAAFSGTGLPHSPIIALRVVFD